VLIGRKSKIDPRLVLDRLAQGKKPREIAAEIGCNYQSLRDRTKLVRRAMGCRTSEQAVAVHVAEKIRAVLPLALQGHVDLVLKRR
jgi:hypothetical protein